MKKVVFSLFSIIAFQSFLFAQVVPGEKAKEFNLKNVDGKMVGISGSTDVKGAIVVFTCNHCPFSKMYESRIIKLHEKYAKLGYPVYAINSNDKNKEPDDSFENMVKLATDKKYPFPYLYDESQEIAKAYGATNTPHVFVLKKNANGYNVEYIGAIDDNAQDESGAKDKFVEKAVDELLAGKAVTTKKVKAIGCTIKWKS
ncbi:MAG: thioredoxin family protein [Bacteroidota bacterium]|nr:thioredoxin family protein [Bacteroidota bacterium]